MCIAGADLGFTKEGGGLDTNLLCEGLQSVLELGGLGGMSPQEIFEQYLDAKIEIFPHTNVIICQHKYFIDLPKHSDGFTLSQINHMKTFLHENFYQENFCT